MPELKGAVVATDDERIETAVRAFGGRVMMTSSKHRSGTDRCGEVLQKLEASGECCDVVINVQGDEPFVDESQLRSLVSCFDDASVQIATLKKEIRDYDTLVSPNAVKVVTNNRGEALYFSRHTIPYVRGVEVAQWMGQCKFYKHVGIYAFRSEVLKSLVALEQGALEKMESLEQLRWLENGYRIQVAETEVENVGIDTLADLEKANEQLKRMK